jgi:hypothetical protein
VQRLPLLTEEERPPWGLHAGPLHQPGLDGADFVPSERVGGGEAPLEASVVQHPAFNVHLLQHQAAGLGDAEPMPKHQQD